MERCTECGRLNPQFAVGSMKPRKQNDRLLPYEGVCVKAFTYERNKRCVACRLGTRSPLGKAPGKGEALTQWLIKVNAR